MERIALLDTAQGSTNKGDEIIMKCLEEELYELMRKYFVLKTPTHLSAFTFMQNLFSLPDTASEINKAKYKFVCGTNLFSANMLHRTNQWNINIINSKPIRGCIFVGVGSKGFDIDNNYSVANLYTRQLYSRLLNKEYFHSVREEKAVYALKKLGFKAINTGCVTLWKLTPEFCSTIPTGKAKSVVFTLTDYNRDPINDKKMIEVIKSKYNDIYFWPQGIYDLDYLNSICKDKEIIILQPSIESFYELLINNDIDYIGTRLHAGIFAMRCKRRSIIISVDERMNSMSRSFKGDNFIKRNSINVLDSLISSNINILIDINWEDVNRWKKQFR